MVLSREKEPVKFKGNKVLYLNKLSKMGADALGCKVPTEYDQSGNPIYSEETTIQDMIDYLTLNGGGGGGSSTPSAQPDRVIIIDSTLEEDIPGKAYQTFSAARTYMEERISADPDKFYLVELPAGEYTEDLVCSNHWILHGNNTIITEPIQTLVTADMASMTELSKSNIHIKDCAITQGFHGTSDMAPNEMPVFRILNCTVYNTIGITTAKIIVATSSVFDCEDDTTTKTKAYITCYVAGVNCQIKRIGKLSELLLYNSLVDTIIDVGHIRMRGCTSAGFTGATTGDQEIYFGNSLIMYGCDFDSVKIKSFSLNADGNLYAYNCTFENLYLAAEDEVDKFYPVFMGCRVRIRDYYSGNTDHNIDGIQFIECSIYNDVHASQPQYFDLKSSDLTIADLCFEVTADAHSKVEFVLNSRCETLNCAANTLVYGDTHLLTSNHQPKHIMYSTDGGTTMSNDPTGATHVGIIKDPTLIHGFPLSTSLYIWIPLS